MGGTGELLGAPFNDEKVVGDGIVRLGYRLRLTGESIEFLVVGVVRLVGLELANDVQSSLRSESSSVASYKSSKFRI